MEPSNHPGKNLIGRLRWQEVELSPIFGDGLMGQAAANLA